MKKEYRITEIPKSVPPMWKLEEWRRIMKTGRPRAWRIVCLASDKSILEGMINDFVRQAAEKSNEIRN